MVVDFEFLADDPFAQRVKNAWDKGFLRAASISWVPLEGGPAGGGQWRDTKSDLLEWSIVSVPADPDALRSAHRRMMQEFLELPPGLAGSWGHDWDAGGPSEAGTAPTPGDGGGRGPTLRRSVLPPHHQEALSEALRLVRSVVEGVTSDSGLSPPPMPDCACPPGGTEEGESGLSEEELGEIGEAVEALLASLVHKEVS